MQFFSFILLRPDSRIVFFILKRKDLG